MTPTTAILWQFWRRHRWGMIGVGAWLLTLVLTVQLGPAEHMGTVIPFVALTPFGLTYLYAIAIFAYGREVDVVSGRSGFPARQFTLPVRTATLVLWPVVIGAVLVALLWVILVVLVLRPVGMALPIWGPAVFWATVLVWVQAVMWWPVGRGWIRILVLYLAQAVVLAGVILSHEAAFGQRELLLTAAVLLPTGIGASWAGVRLARRGWGTVSPERRFDRPTAQGAGDYRFSSIRAAQGWLEWRLGGRYLPGAAILGVLLCWATAPWLEQGVATMLLAGTLPRIDGVSAEAERTLWLIALSAATTLGAVSLGISLGGAGLTTGPGRRPSSFAFVRPISSAELVGIKCRVAARSILLTWVIVGLGIVGWLTWTGRFDALIEFRTAVLVGYADWQAVLLGVTVVAGGIALTWMAMVSVLGLGLAGREWLVHLALGMGIPLAVLLTFLIKALPVDRLLTLLPWVVSGWLAGKVVLGQWSFRAMRPHVSPGVRRLLFLAWLGTLLGISSVGLLLPIPSLALGWLLVAVVLVLPFSRLALCPVALAWNRHR